MRKPDLDELIPIMPSTVLQEYISAGAGIVGIPPLTKHWLETSSDIRVERWVENLKRYVAWAYRKALRRQQAMIPAAQELYGSQQRGLVRNRGVIDPVLKAFNKQCFSDPGRLKDTMTKEPKLFIERNK